MTAIDTGCLSRNLAKASALIFKYLTEKVYKELDKMYLGSFVDFPTIVHEFGHVIDGNGNLV